MNIRRKVTYTDGSIHMSHSYGEWNPIPPTCVAPHILDQLAELESVDSSIYVVEVIPGQGMFEYVGTI
jgi:hypothetical protein